MKQKICKHCDSLYLNKDKNSKFCSSSCAATYNNKLRNSCINKDKTKICGCIDCGSIYEINIRANPNTFLCIDCRIVKKVVKTKQYINIVKRPIKIKLCKYCGNSNCKKIGVCTNPQLIRSLIRYFDFDIKSIGTSKSIDEYNRIVYSLNQDYHVERLSIPDLCRKYNHSDTRNFSKILNSLGIIKRTVSDGIKNSILQGKYNIPVCTNYKSGWHTTWTGDQIFYRSSYELEYAQQLDDQKINYDVESLRIEYWDSQKNSYRIAIPDFYLSETNTIVEIKSSWTYDEINLNDKFKRYTELGYNSYCLYEKTTIIHSTIV